MPKEINNFDVLKEMAKRDKSIALANTLVRAQKTKLGCEITMGAHEQFLHWSMAGTHSFCLIFFDNKEFDDLKKELENS